MLELLTAGTAVLVLLPLLKRYLFTLFFVALLTTEFFYIQIGDGIARGYHFFSVLIVLLLARLVPRLFSSRVFIALLFFVGINLCAVLFSDNEQMAFASLLSLAANISVAMATALILLSGKVSLGKFKQILLFLTLLSVAWGLLQIVAFRLGGINLALSPEQAVQIRMGFGPGFRTESNTFAKYMVLPFLLFLPELIEHRRIKHIAIVYLVFLGGMLMNFTRSSIFGMAGASLFILLRYATQRKLMLLTKKGLRVVAILALGISLLASGVVPVSDYAVHKINNFFNQEEILEGSSSAYRLKMMELIVHDAMTDSKKMLIGNGWGQTQYRLGRRQHVTAGGGDMVTILGYAGLLGVAAYLLYMLLSFYSAWRVTVTRPETEEGKFSEGIMFAIVGIFFTSQMAGYLIAPEYWLLIGLSIFLSLDRQFPQIQRSTVK